MDTLEELEKEYQKIDRANDNVDNFLVWKQGDIEVEEGVFEMTNDDDSSSSVSTSDIVDCWMEIEEYTRRNGLPIFDRMSNEQFVKNFFPT